MDTTIKFDTAKWVAEQNPYLFEDYDSARFEVGALSDGTVDLYLLHPAYQPKMVRDHYAAEYLKNGSMFHKRRSEQEYTWSGVETTLTPKQARKLAKALKRAAEAAESRD